MKIKTHTDITWHDLPNIESPFFAFHEVSNAIAEKQEHEISGLRDILLDMREYTSEAQLNTLKADLESGRLCLMVDNPLSPQFQSTEATTGKKPPGERREIKIITDIFWSQDTFARLLKPTSMYLNPQKSRTAPQPQPETSEAIASEAIASAPIEASRVEAVLPVSEQVPIFEILYSPNEQFCLVLDEAGLKQLEGYEQRLDGAAKQLEAARTQGGGDHATLVAAQDEVRKQLRALSGDTSGAADLAPLVQGKVSFQEMVRIGKAKYTLLPSEFIESYRKKPRHFYRLPGNIIGSVKEVARAEPQANDDALRNWRFTKEDVERDPKKEIGKVNWEKAKHAFTDVKGQIAKDWKLGEYTKSGQIPSDLIARGLFPNLTRFFSDDDFAVLDRWIAQLNQDANISIRCYEKYRQDALKALDKGTDEKETDSKKFFLPEDWDLARRMVADIWGEKSDIAIKANRFEYDKVVDDDLRAEIRDKIARRPLPPTGWDASAGAQFMRYTLGATLKTEFDLLEKGKLALGASAHFDAALAEAKAEGSVYFPNSEGWRLEPRIPVRKEHIEYKPYGRSAEQQEQAYNFQKGEHLPYFAVDSTLLTPAGADSIFDVLASWDGLKLGAERAPFDAARRDIMIQVVGHTSATGSVSYNQALGLRRAAVVADFIRHKQGHRQWLSQFAQGHWGQDEADFMAYTTLILNGSLKVQVDWDELVLGEHKVSLVDRLKQQVPALEELRDALLPQTQDAYFPTPDQWGEPQPYSNPIPRLEWLIEKYIQHIKGFGSGRIDPHEDLLKEIPFFSEPFISKGERELAVPIEEELFQNRRCDFVIWEIDPDKSGIVFENEPVHFGDFYVRLQGHISGWAGANIQLGAELALATPEGMLAVVGGIRDKGRQGKVSEQTIRKAKGAISAGANAAAFAGAKAELGLKGSASWRPPPQEAKYGETYQPPEFKTLGSIGYTLTGMLGIGGKADLKIGFDQKSKRFVIKLAAEACLGPGFGGQLDISVGVGQCWEFITLVHGQLKRHDFCYLDIFEKADNEDDESAIDVFELFSAWSWKMFKTGHLPEAGAALAVGASAELVVKILDDVDKLMDEWDYEKIVEEQTDTLIESIKKQPEMLKRLTPETKGRFLFELINSPHDWMDRLSFDKERFLRLDYNRDCEEAALILI
ncbi:MAG: hypothetical protein P8166_13200, partial [Candidatus Thiodiazotropha sp.]